MIRVVENRLAMKADQIRHNPTFHHHPLNSMGMVTRHPIGKLWVNLMGGFHGGKNRTAGLRMIRHGFGKIAAGDGLTIRPDQRRIDPIDTGARH